MKPDFLEYLNEKVVLADGALGTYLYEKGIALGTNTDLLNIQEPDLIYSVHEEYIRAGSKLIETNTFGANRFKLHGLGKGDQVREINLAGARIAAKAAGQDIFVAGSVGPTGADHTVDADEEETDTTAAIAEAFEEQISALVEGGVDILILETFSWLEELLIAIRVARKLVPDMPLIAQMAYPAGGRTVFGIEAHICGSHALEAGADVVGSNCGRGVTAMLEAVKNLSALRDQAPLSAFPNAGMPEVVDHRTVYSTPPSYMADKVAEMVKLGARLIGGCCGTTPAHIHEFQKHLHLKKTVTVAVRQEASRQGESQEPAVKPGVGGLLQSMNSQRLPVLVELDPPPHLDIDRVLEGADALARAGADAITLAENPLAILRVDNLSLAHIIRERSGIETVIHLTCRDRNVLGLQAQIMGAHLLGLRGILAVTGDPASSTDQPGVSGVFDVNSFGLVRMISQFNRGYNMAGSPMKRDTDFSIGVAFSYRPSNPGLQLRRLEKKAMMGAHFVMTQPIFDAETVKAMMDATAHLDLIMFPGIFPLISARSAEFLHNELPGISIPEPIRKTLWKYEKLEDQRKAGLEITGRLIEDIADAVDGLYLISPLNKWEVPLDLTMEIRKRGWKGTGKLAKIQGK